MQISTRDEDFIIDTLELRSELYILNEAFTDPAIVKVIAWLSRHILDFTAQCPIMAMVAGLAFQFTETSV